MNIETARTFLATVEMGNLNRAAEQLNVTQSTVTARINSLEDELGQKLLVRSKAGTGLTADGFKFLRYAEMLVDTWQQARHEVSLPKGFSGTCQVRFQRDLWPVTGTILADELHKQLPSMALSMGWTTPNELRQVKPARCAISSKMTGSSMVAGILNS